MDNYQGKIEDDGKEEIIGENSGKSNHYNLII